MTKLCEFWPSFDYKQLSVATSVFDYFTHIKQDLFEFQGDKYASFLLHLIDLLLVFACTQSVSDAVNTSIEMIGFIEHIMNVLVVCVQLQNKRSNELFAQTIANYFQVIAARKTSLLDLKTTTKNKNLSFNLYNLTVTEIPRPVEDTNLIVISPELLAVLNYYGQRIATPIRSK